MGMDAVNSIQPPSGTATRWPQGWNRARCVPSWTRTIGLTLLALACISQHAVGQLPLNPAALDSGVLDSGAVNPGAVTSDPAAMIAPTQEAMIAPTQEAMMALGQEAVAVEGVPANLQGIFATEPPIANGSPVYRPAPEIVPQQLPTAPQRPLFDLDQPMERVDPTQMQSAILTALDQRASVTFKDTPLTDVVFSLGEVWDVNIVAGSEVTGTVNGVFKDATLRDVLDAVLTSQGYGYQHAGDSLVIVARDKMGRDDPTLVHRTLKIPRTGGNTEAVLEGAKLLLSERGSMQAIDGTDSLLVVDQSAAIARVEKFLVELGGPIGGASPGTISAAQSAALEVVYFSPQYVDAKLLMQPLSDATAGQLIISVMDEENRLVVLGRPVHLDLAAQIVRQLDAPRAQVRITAMIYDVSLTEMERLGIDWGHEIRSSQIDANGMPLNTVGGSAGLVSRPAGHGATIGQTVTSTAAAGAATGAAAAQGNAQGTVQGTNLLFRMSSNSFEVNSLLSALDQTKGAQLLADPSITTEDRRTANFKIVTKVPVQVLTQTPQGGNIGTTTFEEAGITLNVTPRISRDGTIHLRVRPEYSVLVGYNNGQPIIDSRSAETTARVVNGCTLILGGMRQRTMVETVRGVPGLMHWKYVGKLFRYHETEVRESELLVFIKPELVAPNYGGYEREQSAAMVMRDQIGRIPVADGRCILPNCTDPHCPYHHPRRRSNPGSQDFGLLTGEEGPYEPAPMVPLPPVREQRYLPNAMEPHQQDDVGIGLR
jgi:general secretion pathway protein D